MLYGQDFSSRKVIKLIEELKKSSTDIPSFYNDTTYFVVDNWTQNMIYKNKNYIDNEVHKVFLKVVKKAKVDDLVLMSKNDYPNIRIYAFWGLLMRNKRELAKIVLIDEIKRRNEKVWFDSFGDLILDFTPIELMNELIRIKNYNLD